MKKKLYSFVRSPFIYLFAIISGIILAKGVSLLENPSLLEYLTTLVSKSPPFLKNFFLESFSSLQFSASLLSDTAFFISETFIRLLKLISLPMIYVSIVSVFAGMEEIVVMRKVGKKVLFYTLLTTLLAAFVGLLFFQLLNPMNANHSLSLHSIFSQNSNDSFLSHVLALVPDNIINVFSQGSIVGVLLVAIAMGIAIFFLPEKEKKVLSTFFSSLFAAILKMTQGITAFMPLAVWAFVFILTRNLEKELIGKDIGSDITIKHIMLYVYCIIGAQLFHGVIVLPVLLKFKRLNPSTIFSKTLPALSIAFLSKSSNAALPVVMKCGREKLKISKQVTEFTFPLCSTINMNGGAIFILVTVLFISAFHGITYTWIDLLGWVGICSLAAISNAGVPMGSYMFVVALLNMANIPFSLSGVVLTLNAILFDMLETTNNVWSDVCIATIVDKELKSDGM